MGRRRRRRRAGAGPGTRIVGIWTCPLGSCFSFPGFLLIYPFLPPPPLFGSFRPPSGPFPAAGPGGGTPARQAREPPRGGGPARGEGRKAGAQGSERSRLSESMIRVDYPNRFSSRLSESIIRVDYPSRFSELVVRVGHPCWSSESIIRVDYSSRLSESIIRVDYSSLLASCFPSNLPCHFPARLPSHLAGRRPSDSAGRPSRSSESIVRVEPPLAPFGH